MFQLLENWFLSSKSYLKLSVFVWPIDCLGPEHKTLAIDWIFILVACRDRSSQALVNPLRQKILKVIIICHFGDLRETTHPKQKKRHVWLYYNVLNDYLDLERYICIWEVTYIFRCCHFKIHDIALLPIDSEPIEHLAIFTLNLFRHQDKQHHHNHKIYNYQTYRIHVW